VRSRQPRAHTRGDPGMERPHARREERPRAGDLRPATSADPGQHTSAHRCRLQRRRRSSGQKSTGVNGTNATVLAQS
jgi:hypothetical protein